MQQNEQAFKERRVAIAVVTFETDVFAHRYVEETGIAWPLLVDNTKEIYRAYGMWYASVWNIWGFSTWWVYMKLLARGQRLAKSQGDYYQRGGNVLIDPDGVVRFHHIGKGPADRPAVKTLLRMIDC